MATQSEGKCAGEYTRLPESEVQQECGSQMGRLNGRGLAIAQFQCGPNLLYEYLDKLTDFKTEILFALQNYFV